jgi:phage gp46-like protein
MIRIRFDNHDQVADLVRLNLDSNLQDNDETALETAVLLSMFTEGRATLDELKPSGEQFELGEYRGGWWGDSYSVSPWGSRLWTLNRAVLSATSVQRAKKYTEECLQWMLDDRVASAISVAAERVKERCHIRTDIHRPGPGSTFARVWEVKFNAL